MIESVVKVLSLRYQKLYQKNRKILSIFYILFDDTLEKSFDNIATFQVGIALAKYINFILINIWEHCKRMTTK